MADYTDIDKLRELAEAATPGPWKWSVSVDHQWALVEPAEDNLRILAQLPDDDDAAFIAAASPDVILALVAELVGLRTEVDQLRTAIKQAIAEWELHGTKGVGNTFAALAAVAARPVSDTDDGAMARAVRAERLVEAIRRLHEPIRNVDGVAVECTCGDDAKCPTAAALDVAVPVVGAEEPAEQAEAQ